MKRVVATGAGLSALLAAALAERDDVRTIGIRRPEELLPPAAADVLEARLRKMPPVKDWERRERKRRRR